MQSLTAIQSDARLCALESAMDGRCVFPSQCSFFATCWSFRRTCRILNVLVTCLIPEACMTHAIQTQLRQTRLRSRSLMEQVFIPEGKDFVQTLSRIEKFILIDAVKSIHRGCSYKRRRCPETWLTSWADPGSMQRVVVPGASILDYPCA